MRVLRASTHARQLAEAVHELDGSVENLSEVHEQSVRRVLVNDGGGRGEWRGGEGMIETRTLVGGRPILHPDCVHRSCGEICPS